MTDDLTPFSSLLVANRGEIALRVMRTARARGLRCIAVYTDADAGAEFVEFADLALRIGAGPVGDSYLSVENILKAAQDSGAGAVHPGYGFLSENPEFARAVRTAGLVFVGPSEKAIAAMGNKAAARQLMESAGVACVPGYDGADNSDTALVKAAATIGFPLMVKAAEGGGGRGMRLVTKAADLAQALKQARAEAAAAFGSDQLILEKAISPARHIEVQIFADRAGNTIHLGERDCSVQRRHQKVIEESPSPVVNAALRKSLGKAAVNAARAVGYEGAGTVEFLLGADGGFYFLEMNTRLQVEHAVTEEVTGLDLVALQLVVAAGKPLPLKQTDVRLSGHAIEARLYAETPAAGFLPASGLMHRWEMPEMPGFRVDAGCRAGQEVSPHYDPMLAKLVAKGADREAARRLLLRALRESVVFGPHSNRNFLIDILDHADFAAGQVTTGFIAENFGADGPPETALEFADIAAVAALWLRDRQERALKIAGEAVRPLLGWSSSGVLTSRLRLRVSGEALDLDLRLDREGVLRVQAGEKNAEACWQGEVLRVNGQRREVGAFLNDGRALYAVLEGHDIRLDLLAGDRADAGNADSGQLRAPMHGRLIGLMVAEGQTVVAGQALAVLEAMKMQHELRAGICGRITKLHVSEGAQVQAGDVILEIDND